VFIDARASANWVRYAILYAFLRREMAISLQIASRTFFANLFSQINPARDAANHKQVSRSPSPRKPAVDTPHHDGNYVGRL
jgi:hypothetical protein